MASPEIIVSNSEPEPTAELTTYLHGSPEAEAEPEKFTNLYG